MVLQEGRSVRPQTELGQEWHAQYYLCTHNDNKNQKKGFNPLFSTLGTRIRKFQLKPEQSFIGHNQYFLSTKCKAIALFSAKLDNSKKCGFAVWWGGGRGAVVRLCFVQRPQLLSAATVVLVAAVNDIRVRCPLCRGLLAQALFRVINTGAWNRGMGTQRGIRKYYEEGVR